MNRKKNNSNDNSWIFKSKSGRRKDGSKTQPCKKDNKHGIFWGIALSTEFGIPQDVDTKVALHDIEEQGASTIGSVLGKMETEETK
jgi:hypothetical protein